MPAWLISLLVAVLQKTGAINWLEGVAIKAGLNGIQDLKKIKTYSAPTDFPNPPPQETPNNLNKNG